MDGRKPNFPNLVRRQRGKRWRRKLFHTHTHTHTHLRPWGKEKKVPPPLTHSGKKLFHSPRYYNFCAYISFLPTYHYSPSNEQIAICLSLPLGGCMVVTGAVSIASCSEDDGEKNETSLPRQTSGYETSPRQNADPPGDPHGFPPVMVAAWLVVAGAAVLSAPAAYLAYDKYWKSEEGGPLVKRAARVAVVSLLLFGLVWSVLGFLWVFGGREDSLAVTFICCLFVY